jgi:hypothetical protein
MPAKKLQVVPPPKPLPVTWLSDVKEEKVDWLMPGVPRGEVTIIDGDPKAGKSWVTFSWAAAVSIGKYPHLPGWAEREPGKVLIFSLENSSTKVIKPRLKHLGADMSNIGVIEVPVVLDEGNLLSIEKAVAETKPDFIIFDPIVAYIGGGLDMNQANKVRQPMQRLQMLAAKFQCAVVVVRHLNKGNGSKALYRGQGSIDFVASVRSAFVAVTNPENPDERALHHIACNLGKEIEPLGYEIINTPDNVGILVWMGSPQFNLETALTHQTTSQEDAATKKDAVSRLREILNGGEVASAYVDQMFEAEGFSKYALKKAKRELKVKATAEKQGGDFKDPVKWFLSLPPEEVDYSTEGVVSMENRLLPYNNIYKYNNIYSLVEEVECKEDRPLPTTSIALEEVAEEVTEVVESQPEVVESPEHRLLPLSNRYISSYVNFSTEEVDITGKRLLPLHPSTSPTSGSESDLDNTQKEALTALEREGIPLDPDDLDPITREALTILDEVDGINAPSILAAKKSLEMTGEVHPDQLEILRANLSIWRTRNGNGVAG